jgi:hypothetical protein
MTTAHQQFSARTRKSGELDQPGKRRRNLDTGRLSVVFGADPCVVLEDLAAKDDRSVGGLIRKIVVEWLEGTHGLDKAALATRAAQLRAAKAASDDLSDEQPSPAPATPAAV